MSEMQYLAESYFHQDFELDAATPLDLIKEFRDSEPPEVVARLAAEVEETLRLTSESAMREQWTRELRASYEPDRRGSSYREWFERVLEVLREPS